MCIGAHLHAASPMRGGMPPRQRHCTQVCSQTPNPKPQTLNPTPYTLHPAPCTLHPAPCTLHPARQWHRTQVWSTLLSFSFFSLFLSFLFYFFHANGIVNRHGVLFRSIYDIYIHDTHNKTHTHKVCVCVTPVSMWHRTQGHQARKP